MSDVMMFGIAKMPYELAEVERLAKEKNNEQ